MRRSLRVRLALAAVTVGAVAVAALPASASTGSLVFTGVGTISPGLTQNGGTTQTFTVDTLAAVVATDQLVSADLSCGLSGNDTTSSWSQGDGSFSGSCSIPGSPATSTSLAGSYVRTFAGMTMSGYASGGLFSGTFNGDCGFVPASVDTFKQLITEFSMTCTLTLT